MTDADPLAQQRAACPFCRIIRGEIPSTKVYEDEGFIAVLDIRPAAPGHVLLVPKDHAPILQLLPEPRLRAVFPLATRLAGAVKDAMISRSVDIVVVNGLAPGQQSPHAIVHLIPREPGDRLGNLDLERLETQQSDTIALAPQLEATVREVLARLAPGALAEAAPPVAPPEQSPPAPARQVGERHVEFDDPKQALAHVLDLNPDLRKLIIEQPSLVEDYVRQSPRLAKLFQGVDIPALSAALRAQQADPPCAKDMSDPELFAFIQGNDGLRAWLLEAPDELVAHVRENPRLSAFFEGVDVRALANRFAAFQGGAS